MILVRKLAACLVMIMLAPAVWAPASDEKIVYLSYVEVRRILEALADILPAELRTHPEQAAAWAGWVARRDAEIRARLAQGDVDSLVNLLLFGTSYTRQPRVTAEYLARLEQKESQAGGATSSPSPFSAEGVLLKRLDDLVRALAAPGSNERLSFMRRLVAQQGHGPDAAAGGRRLKQYLLAHLSRVLKEHAGYTRVLEAARLLRNPTEEFAERSQLYQSRGLALDTSLLPNFAVEESLKAMQARGLLAPGSVRRVAIVGPGLDFTDKQDGYDFYPQQTLQPFAVIDSLLRLGLARRGAVEVTTLDISPRVNDHLLRARERARRGPGYSVQLPRDLQRRWRPEVIRYWERFGSHIGVPAPAAAVPATAGKLKIRAVRIRPGMVASITPVDLNIILQRVDFPAEQGFDLMVATNVFVYYGVLEQSLALASVEQMLRPGGLLLSNNALLELPASGMRSVDYLTVVYSEGPDDGDHLVWYRRSL